ncbi:MAG: helix-turn-helix domain-containing protein [Schleiferiaceae bacterium]
MQDRFPGIENYCSQTEIARYFGVSKSTMHRIMKSEEDQ